MSIPTFGQAFPAVVAARTFGIAPPDGRPGIARPDGAGPDEMDAIGLTSAIEPDGVPPTDPDRADHAQPAAPS